MGLWVDRCVHGGGSGGFRGGGCGCCLVGLGLVDFFFFFLAVGCGVVVIMVVWVDRCWWMAGFISINACLT